MSALEYLQSLVGRKGGSPGPAGIWMDAEITHVEEGSITMKYVVNRLMTNPLGGLHGGLIAFMMDEAVSWCNYSLNHTHFYTGLNLHVDFLNPCSSGDTVYCEAKVIRQGKRVVNTECELRKQNGVLVARGTSNLGITSLKTDQFIDTKNLNDGTA